MRSISIALAWEFWRRAAVWVVAVPLGMSIWPAVVYLLLINQGLRDFRNETGFMLHVSFLLCSLVCGVTAIVQAAGVPRSRYALPVKTRTLLGWTLLHSMVAAAAMYLVQAALVNWAFDAGWPYLGPAAASAVAAAWTVGI